MTKRFNRTITGGIYDSQNDVFVHEDYVDKPIGYEDEVIILLNELAEENQKLKSKVDDITVAVEVETCKVIENVINLIDKKIESHKDDISSYGSMYGAYLEDRLNELKKELK